ncbi:MAG: sigma factor-like helix-turn-helix DNA-binding protein [Candidatus Pacebacteria bacterium]|nr:sigma factor-like helix-turn-helix DNA-binding protein [Candidatus Paceibacterota bacterium]
MKNTVSFNPILVTKKLLNGLDERPRDVLEKRFGLYGTGVKTLESIGGVYGITRERVRQIEAFALDKIRQSKDFSSFGDVFDELKNHIDTEGGLVQEEHFLTSRAKQDDHKNHILFLLVVGEPFEKIKEDDHFYHSWTTDMEKAEAIMKSLRRFHSEFDQKKVLSEKEMLFALEKRLKDAAQHEFEENILHSLLKVSKILSSNALGEWGSVYSSFIKPRGMRDFALLVMRKHGSPMHFSEVAGAIKDIFKKPAHVQTVHNELIKNEDNFVLVGRGLYALKEWGYEGGIVRDVIKKVISQSGPLAKEDIIKKVLKERYVKENTILVNLQNKEFFKRNEKGYYTLI